jgi:hypothetical protein
MSTKVFSVIMDKNNKYDITPLKMTIKSGKTLFVVLNLLCIQEVSRTSILAV